MRTARLLPVSPSMHCSRGVCLVQGGGCVPGPGGVLGPRGEVPGPWGGFTWSRGVYLVRGGVSGPGGRGEGVPGPGGGTCPGTPPCGQKYRHV